tara:strand:+ start:712 stop:1143 length:432 start_codon:yes stop_codon:yes gene_type:complete
MDEKFLYFRNVTDEDDDDAITADSVLVPVSKITGMLPNDGGSTSGAANQIEIFFESMNNIQAAGNDEVVKSDSVIIEVNQGSSFAVMSAIVDAMNATGAAYQDGYIVVADDVTTDFDGTTRDAVYLVPDITGCGTIAIAAANS